MVTKPAQALDELARAIFDPRRDQLASLLQHFDERVGRVQDGDDLRETWLAARLDWALCDAELPDEPRTWLMRGAKGEVSGVDQALAQGLLPNHAGLFEVWPARRGAFLRDVVAGVCVSLDEPVELLPQRSGPAALWDVRVLLTPPARLCRRPFAYPLTTLPLLHRAQARRFGRGPSIDLLSLRRAWLRCRAQAKLPVEATFSSALGLGSQR